MNMNYELFIHDIKPKNYYHCIKENWKKKNGNWSYYIHDWNQHIPWITLVLLPLDLSKSLLLVAKFRISKASLSETSISVKIKKKLKNKSSNFWRVIWKIKGGVWKWKWNLEQGGRRKCEEWSGVLCNQQLRAFLSLMRILVAFQFPYLSLVTFAHSSFSLTKGTLLIFVFLCAFLKYQIQKHSSN